MTAKTVKSIRDGLLKKLAILAQLEKLAKLN